MDVYLLLFAVGLLAGAMNAVAGGGSFITFPALLYAGIPPVMANASSTVALLPGSLAGSWQYRSFIRPFNGIPLLTMIMLTFIGGCAGAVLLLNTPSTHFSRLVPWLLLIGSVAFAFGKSVGQLLQEKIRISSAAVLIAQFILGVYGGYFGGAVGIMMMAVWYMFGMADIKMINANKNLLVAVANSIAAALFIIGGQVAWKATVVMLVATTIGGYAGGHYSRDMNPVLLRRIIVVFNFVITLLFFIKYYWRAGY